MTIYTRRGDSGETSLADGSRVAKSSPRVEAYGTIDEANSAIGFARAAVSEAVLDDILAFIQQRLFNCAANLATPHEAHEDTTPAVSEEDLTFLEHAIDAMLRASGGVQGFVLPAGGETSARLHLARTVLRRAERRCDALARSHTIDPLVLGFLNRASDALYAASRYAAALDDIAEEQWDVSAKSPDLP